MQAMATSRRIATPSRGNPAAITASGKDSTAMQPRIAIKSESWFGEHLIPWGLRTARLPVVSMMRLVIGECRPVPSKRRLTAVFASPFSTTRDENLVIQYTLSDESNIDILIVGLGGEIIKKFSFSSGEEGGQAALNQVTWDGRRDWGSLIANGVYLGIIISRDQNKVLGNFKLTAYN